MQFTISSLLNPNMLQTKFGQDWLNDSREEDTYTTDEKGNPSDSDDLKQ